MDRAPHPFVLGRPGPPEQLVGTVPLRLVLIGRSIDYLPHVVWAVHAMSQRGLGAQRRRYRLARLLVQNEEGGTEVWDFDGRLLVRAGFRRYRAGQDLSDERASRIRLRFLTPLRIRHQRRLCTHLTFPILMTNVLRRLYLLDRFHGDGTWEFEHRELIEAAEGVRTVRYNLRWHDWTRYSSRQDTKMQLGGLIGEVEFEGDLTPFLPYLRVSEEVHVGRNTSFGLGRMSSTGSAGIGQKGFVE